MPLTSGVRLGPYEIVSLLGAGGMGEVYRARDTRLGRDVAIKVLPDAFVKDAERLARFEREARLISQLNHPYICAVYHIGDAANPQSPIPNSQIQFLVLELVDGPTLADRIAQGPMPIDEVLPVARQITEALEAAHEHGIIHRDLKPANIKLTSEGVVKVLDFGLAKLGPQAPDSAAALSHSPTITSPMMTMGGVILGTAAYMSPEQAKGKPLDKRTDVWAFGCVLYEMLTGRRAFGGEDVTDTIAAVVRAEPDWKQLPGSTPVALRRLLRRALEKDRKRRLSDIADARLEIDEASGGPSDAPETQAARTESRRWTSLLSIGAAIALTSAMVGAAVWYLRPGPAPQRPTTRFALRLPMPLSPLTNQPIAISRDGTRIVYVGQTDDGTTRLYQRTLDQLEPVEMAGVGGRGGGGVGSGAVGSVFLSPDGEWIGFNDTSEGALRKISVRGGPAAPICPLPSGKGGYRGASWGARGSIVFATTAAPGLMEVPAVGGVPKPLTKAQDPEHHAQPHFLPDGSALLYVQRSGATSRVAVLSMRTGEQRALFDGSSPSYAASGHIVFLRDGSIWAVPFDDRVLKVTGEAVPIQQGVSVRTSPRGDTRGDFSISLTGTLVYVAGPGDVLHTLAWIDRRGREEAISAPARAYMTVRLSPDGSRAVTDIRDQESDIWVWSFKNPSLIRLTTDRAQDNLPVWTPDSEHVLFGSNRAAAGSEIFAQAADATGGARLVFRSSGLVVPTSISPDGSALLIAEGSIGGNQDLSLITLEDGKRQALLATEKFNETNAEFSPDGRWFAYESNESGQNEVYVRPFPAAQTRRWQVSNGGGSRPVWARNGQELFYAGSTGALMAVSVRPASTFTFGSPMKIVETAYFGSLSGGARSFDVAPDGRFLMIKRPPTPASATLVVVENWLDHLRTLVPSK